LALSSSEAEYYGMSEASKDVKFVAMILEAIGIEIELPIIMGSAEMEANVDVYKKCLIPGFGKLLLS
jgi:hypothetical protein